MIETNLVGKIVRQDAFGIKEVDVVKGVLGLEQKVFTKRAITLPYQITDTRYKELSVLHPIDLVRSRISNMYYIEAKQTLHHADQAQFSFEISKKYFEIKIKRYNRERDKDYLFNLITELREMASFATDEILQGTANNWQLDIKDALPIEQLRLIEDSEDVSKFLNVEWPEITEKSNQLLKPKDVEKLKEKSSSTVKFKP